MASKKPKTKKKNAAATKMGNWSLKVFFGDIMSSNIFSKYKFTIFIVVALLMFYIAFKFECQARMETIEKLESELARIKSEAIREKGEYMSSTRESMMQQLVDSMHLGLRIQQQPPYKLTYDDK